MSDADDQLTWKRIEPTVVQKFGYRTMVEKTFELPDGRTHSFTTMSAEGGRAAGVIAVTTDGQVVIARQFRPGPEKIMDELPGGGVEKGEDPEVAARRELLEETGYVPGAMKFLGTSCRDAYMNPTWYYYLATGCTLSPEGQRLDETEHIEVCLISIDTLISNARQDRMTDPVAVLQAYDELDALRRTTHG